MIRLTEDWFEFDGVRSDAMHVRLTRMPTRPRAAEKGEAFSVAGGDGDLWVSENAYDVFTLNVEFVTVGDDFDVNAISAWLTGSGMLRFADEPKAEYRARVHEQFTRDNRFASFRDQIYTVTFTCQPHRYKHIDSEAEDDVTIISSGDAIQNTTNTESLPLITVRGTGDCELQIGGQNISIEGMVNGILIDSDLMDCFDLDETELLNRICDMDEFPVLRVGYNAITWEGNITSVTIRPRWRYI